MLTMTKVADDNAGLVPTAYSAIEGRFGMTSRGGCITSGSNRRFSAVIDSLLNAGSDVRVPVSKFRLYRNNLVIPLYM